MGELALDKRLKSCCPLCGGQLQIGKLTVNLDTNHIAFGAKAVKVYPKHAELISVLLAANGRASTNDHIQARVWGQDSDISLQTIRVTVYKARTFLKQLGWTIKTENNCGYRLVQL